MVVDNATIQEVEHSEEIENLLIRSSLYQVLSVCYLFPEEEKLSFLQSEEIQNLLENAEKIKTCYSEYDVTALIKSLNALYTESCKTDLEDLQSMYNRIVGHTMSKDCPFYEGQYGAAHVHQQVHELADIQAFYRAFCLDISEAEKERCDHISVELEFLQFLLFKQAYALEHHGRKEAEVCLDAQKKFLKEHAGKWVPLLAILLGRKARDGFYFIVSEITKEFVRLEMKLLGVETEMFKESDLNQDEVAGAPDECLSCAGLDDSESN